MKQGYWVNTLKNEGVALEVPKVLHADTHFLVVNTSGNSHVYRLIKK